MRRRKITKPDRRINVPTERPNNRVFDSSKFDYIDPQRLVRAFKTTVPTHTEFLLDLLASKIAFDTAAHNVQETAANSLGSGVEVIDDKTALVIDQAYDVAVRLYIYRHLLDKVFSDDVTKRELLVLFAGSSAPKTAVKPPTGARAAKDAELDIDALEQRLSRRFGASDRSESPFGARQRNTVPAKKVRSGVLKRKS